MSAEPRMSVFYGHLTRLIAREDFIEFSRCESYRSDAIIMNLSSLVGVVSASLHFVTYFSVFWSQCGDKCNVSPNGRRKLN
jgi:hypothetical protein